MFHGEKSPRGQHPDTLTRMMTLNRFIFHLLRQNFDKHVIAEGFRFLEFVHQVLIGVLLSKDPNLFIFTQKLLLFLKNLCKHYLLLPKQFLRLFLVKDDLDQLTMILQPIVILNTENILHNFLLLTGKQASDIILLFFAHGHLDQKII